MSTGGEAAPPLPVALPPVAGKPAGVNHDSTLATTHHLPLRLSAGLHRELQSLAKESGRPATALAREALEEWTGRQRRFRLSEEIAADPAATAGSNDDLDPNPERAALDLG